MRGVPKLLHYKCKTCGNQCLQEAKPENSACGGCDSPDWKLMKHQEAYEVGKESFNHPNGEI